MASWNANVMRLFSGRLRIRSAMARADSTNSGSLSVVSACMGVFVLF